MELLPCSCPAAMLMQQSPAEQHSPRHHRLSTQPVWEVLTPCHTVVLLLGRLGQSRQGRALAQQA